MAATYNFSTLAEKRYSSLSYTKFHIQMTGRIDILDILFVELHLDDDLEVLMVVAFIFLFYTEIV